VRRISLSFLILAGSALAGLTGLASGTAPAITPGVRIFEAHLQDAPCGSGTFCGAGRLTGFGRLKTRATFRPFGTPPAAGCVSVGGTRSLTLSANRKDTLRLAVKGTACGLRGWGTFEVSSGRGIFAAATGSGVILGSLTNTQQEHLHYSGVITLAH
jgi:hypothetical protein